MAPSTLLPRFQRLQIIDFPVEMMNCTKPGLPSYPSRVQSLRHPAIPRSTTRGLMTMVVKKGAKVMMMMMMMMMDDG